MTLATNGDIRWLSNMDEVVGSASVITSGCMIHMPTSVTATKITNLRTWLSFSDLKVKFLLTKKLAIKAIVVEK